MISTRLVYDKFRSGLSPGKIIHPYSTILNSKGSEDVVCPLPTVRTPSRRGEGIVRLANHHDLVSLEVIKNLTPVVRHHDHMLKANAADPVLTLRLS